MGTYIKQNPGKRDTRLLTTKTIISKVLAHAGVVELVDTQASGVCGGNPVEVQVLSSVCISLSSKG